MELQKYLSKFLVSKRKKKLSDKEASFHAALRKILGRDVTDIQFYKEAFSLKNCASSKNRQNYERLEFWEIQS